MQATERFTQESILQLREAILDAGNGEVFAIGKLDTNGLVASLVIAARGNDASVPALEGFLDRGDVLIHNHPSGILKPSQADVDIAARSGQYGVGSYIVDNEVTKVFVTAEPVRSRSLVALDPDELAGILDNGGKLAARLGTYEPRTSQLELIRAMTGTFNDGGVLAAEAGTGVGKSFAYLIPALAWAARNKERVVVSTATINLQQQLTEKDIPLVTSVFKKKLKAVLVKGRGNYLCRMKLAEAIDEEGIFAVDDNPLVIIKSWAEHSATGDKADLSFWPEDQLWHRVRSESDDCLNMRCPFRDSCFVLQARKAAAEADMLVANHHMLFSDLASRANGAGYEATAVLPPYTTIVFDEAHAVESSATGCFSQNITRFDVYRQLSKLYRERRGRKFGIIIKLQNLKGLPVHILRNFPDADLALRQAMEAADTSALSFLGSETNVRLTGRTRALEALVLEPLASLERAVITVSGLLKDAIDDMPDEYEGEQSITEVQLALMRFSELAAKAARFRTFDEDNGNVYWLERKKTGQGEFFISFNITPLDIATIMNEAVFGQFRQTAFVSATLSVGGSFDFWKRRTGLSRSDVPATCIEFPSPFPYDRNALLCAATTGPTPDSPEWQQWLSYAVSSLIEASQGRALVLFTSYATLRSVWEAVKPGLDDLGIPALRQGDSERTRLLDSFRESVTSVLFATDSFWEGIDAPGETLQHVIITKLPFKVPTDPVQKARAEDIERRGGNAFMDLSLPEAVIRFKQGFGRLIRHSGDRGVVSVLDVRMMQKRYGHLFVDSLPRTQRSFGPVEVMTDAVRSFLYP